MNAGSARVLRWLAFCAMLLAPLAHSGIQSPCDDPTMLSGANVQVYIVPYETDQTLSPQARALATLMQRHILFAALKYRSIAVAELIANNGPCDPQRIAGQLSSALRKGQTALVLSGQMFEQNDRIYLKSAVTVLTGDHNSAMRWPVPGGSEGDVALLTTVPASIQSFAPRTIALHYLENMQRAQRDARRLHAAPDMNSPARELPDDPAEKFIFFVLGAKDDWMQVRVQPYGIEGWLPAHALATGGELKGSFPELYFIDGLVGLYGISGDRAHADRTAELARKSFSQYLAASADAGESEARALAAVLQGNTYLLAALGGWSNGTLRAAQRDYRRARDILPNSMLAANHDLACTTVLCLRGTCGDDLDELHDGYLSALSLDPGNPDLLHNLGVFYDAAVAGRLATTLDVTFLTQQQKLMRQIQVDREMPPS